MSEKRRAGSVVLPMLALLWFIATVAGGIFGHEYFVDARTRSISSMATVVTAVGPSAAAAGLQVGDILDRSRLSRSAAFRAMGMTPRGRPVELAAVRNGVVIPIVAPAVRLARDFPMWDQILGTVVAAFSFGLLAFVGYRKPSMSVAFLIFFVGGALLSWPHLMALFTELPDSSFTPLAYLFRTLCGLLPVMLLASFAIRLGADDSPRRRIAVHVVDAIVVVGFLTDGFVYGANLYNAQIVASAVLLLVAACLALAWATPKERNRIAIVFAAIMIGGVGYAAAMLGNQYGLPFQAFIAYTTASVIIIPLALAYAILRHRVFDITFVLNRTIVYAATSAVLLIVFAALEFLAERYLAEMTHIASAIVEFLIALAVILSARLLHSRVDRFVDAVLFRARHEQELALRRFATTVQFYTDQRPLVSDAVAALERYGSVTGAAIYLTGGGSLERVASTWPQAADVVDENDLGYVELRAHRQTLDLHNLTTALPGTRLYPMTLSGRLVGAVVVGDRRGAEQMPPDIDEVIARVSESIAISIAAIETDAVRQENALLQQRLSTLAIAAP